MFIFDADTHLTLTEKIAQTADELLRNMDKAKIDKSLVWLQPPYMRAIEDANRYVYESAKRFHDRLVPFGWVDPHFGMERSMEMLRVCLDEYGMHGIKLNGAQNDFCIDDPAIDPIIAELEKRDSVLALHVGSDFFDNTHPARVERIAKRHPNLRMLLAHMGGAGLPDLGDYCIEVAAEHPNLMLIGSAISYLKVMKAIKTLGAERVCFGSDSPFRYQHVEVAAYQALLDGEVTQEEKEKIMGLNLMRFLRLTKE